MYLCAVDLGDVVSYLCVVDLGEGPGLSIPEAAYQDLREQQHRRRSVPPSGVRQDPPQPGGRPRGHRSRLAFATN